MGMLWRESTPGNTLITNGDPGEEAKGAGRPFVFLLCFVYFSVFFFLPFFQSVLLPFADLRSFLIIALLILFFLPF